MKRIKSILCVVLAALTLLAFSSCSYKQAELYSKNLLDGYTRNETEKVAVSAEFIKALTDFSLELNKRVTEKDGKNVVISPLSAYICLAMVANGAKGETRTEMEKTLGMKVEDVNENLYAFVNGLYSSKNCSVKLADSIWFRDDKNVLKVREDFLQLMVDWYDADIYSSPFDDSTVKDINNWVKNKTDGLIDKLVEELGSNDMMVLINAVLFEAKWAEEYKSDNVINNYTFQNYNKTESNVTMLVSTEYGLFKGKNYMGTAKDYDGKKYSLVTILPNEGVDVYDLLNSFTSQTWSEMFENKMGITAVELIMPEFKCEFEKKLNDVLEDMGTKLAFTDNADFSGMDNTKADMYVSLIKQKAYICVDRKGTKAAAATSATMTNKSTPPRDETIVLDRPYIYAIVDKATNVPIFIGVNVGL